MSLYQGPKISTEGLVFAYDMSLPINDRPNKSWKGKPAVNTWYNDSYNYTNGATFSIVTDYPSTQSLPIEARGKKVIKLTANTPGTLGQCIPWRSGVDQVNGGTYNHSVWCYLESGSVVTVGQHWNPWDYGSSQYPPLGKWVRLNDPVTNSANNYGNIANAYRTDGVAYFTAPQYELGTDMSPFVHGTRSSTTSLLDWTGNHTINLSSMNYPSDGTFRFTSNSHNITVDSNGFYISGPKTLSIWIRSDRPLSVSDNWEVGFLNQGSTQGSMFGFMYGVGNCQDLGFWGYGSSYDMSVESTTNKWSSDGNWHNGVITMDSSRNVRVYIDGEAKQWLKHSDYSTKVDYVTMPIDTTNYFLINSRAAWNSGMSYVDLGNVMVYDRDLTPEEVKQNYNALTNRFS